MPTIVGTYIVPVSHHIDLGVQVAVHVAADDTLQHLELGKTRLHHFGVRGQPLLWQTGAKTEHVLM